MQLGCSGRVPSDARMRSDGSIPTEASVHNGPTASPPVLGSFSAIRSSMTATQSVDDPAAWRVSWGSLTRHPKSGMLAEGSVRADFGEARHRYVDLEFVYLGPSTQDVALASGEMRRQIGIIMRSQNICNLVYIMWHLEPKPVIEILTKRNPDLRTHEECGDRGYTLIASTSAPARLAFRVGERRRLAARLDGLNLTVWVDDGVAWQGDLSPEVLTFDGPHRPPHRQRTIPRRSWSRAPLTFTSFRFESRNSTCGVRFSPNGKPGQYNHR